jgi:hypothetical protein
MIKLKFKFNISHSFLQCETKTSDKLYSLFRPEYKDFIDFVLKCNPEEAEKPLKDAKLKYPVNLYTWNEIMPKVQEYCAKNFFRQQILAEKGLNFSNEEQRLLAVKEKILPYINNPNMLYWDKKEYPGNNYLLSNFIINWSWQNNEINPAEIPTEMLESIHVFAGDDVFLKIKTIILQVPKLYNESRHRFNVVNILFKKPVPKINIFFRKNNLIALPETTVEKINNSKLLEEIC